MGVVVLSVELIPLGALISAALDPQLRRRSQFRLRFTGFLVCVSFPELVVGIGSMAGIFREQAVILLLIGLLWSLALLALAPLLLFHGPGFDPGQSDEDGEGPDPGDDGPSPSAPVGGLPLPDAEQSFARLRGPRELRPSVGRRRRVGEPKRSPARVLRLRTPSRP